MKKRRLDELLVDIGLFPNAHDAKAAVIAGEVVVDDHRAESAAMMVPPDACVRMKAKGGRGGFVSRGGLKLASALEDFDIDVAGLDAADLGASSGGFTDCLLQKGASHVSAVDVGRAQFAYKLRIDPRVSLFEHTNIRDVSAQDIGGPFDIVVADLSFISLAKVMEDIRGFMKEGADLVALVKPQFEAEKRDVGEGGVVESRDVHARCIEKVIKCANENGIRTCGLASSPITGPAGNIEFLFWGRRTTDGTDADDGVSMRDVMRTVDDAHLRLRGGSCRS